MTAEELAADRRRMPRSRRRDDPPARARRRRRALLDAEAYRAAIAAICEAVGDRLVVQITSESHGPLRAGRADGGGARDQPRGGLAGAEGTRARGAGRAAVRRFPQRAEADAASGRSSFFMRRRRPSASRRCRSGASIPFDELAVLYVLGRFTLLRTAAPSDLLPFLAPDVPRFAHWSVCAFGRREAACVTAGALLGGPRARRLREQSRAARTASARRPTPSSSPPSRGRSATSGSRLQTPTRSRERGRRADALRRTVAGCPARRRVASCRRRRPVARHDHEKL